MKTLLAAAFFLSMATVTGVANAADDSFVGAPVDRDLIGLPVLTEMAVKVGHVTRASGIEDGALEHLVVDTSSSGRPGLNGKLAFDAETLDVRPNHVFISMTEAERLN